MRALIALVLLVTALPAAAQSVVVSEAAENVSLTVYRAPQRGGRPINKNWPQGYALITETRTVNIPAGESVIRFEGVSEGMFPESAIVTGLPEGVREKNQDARLLSPAGLVDAYLKRQVTVQRTNLATGKMTSQTAMITTGPNGVILQTGDGYEALRCTGLPERMVYGGVPKGLSAKPTLSVITQSEKAISAELTLTYLSAGFDWQANYLVQMQDEKATSEGEAALPKHKASLFAWLTLANGGSQSFANANTMAIAGEPNRERRRAQARPTGKALTLKCWPMQRTHQVPFFLPYDLSDEEENERMDGAMEMRVMPAPPPMIAPPPSPAPVAAIKAQQEDIGDLKLYRIPERVNVNAKGQKQVAMITQPDAIFDRVYFASAVTYNSDNQPFGIKLRGKNDDEGGLGLPMPSGQIQVFEGSNFGPLLVGETNIKDLAVGQKVEMIVGSSTDVRRTIKKMSERGRKQNWRVEIANARSEPVNVEVELPANYSGKTMRVRKVDGVPTWIGIIPAGGEISFNYVLKRPKK